MRIEGTLAKLNDDRGFGFIVPVQGGVEVFVHISAFPKVGPRPTLGERVSFEIELTSDGKKRAKNLVFSGRPAVRSAPRSTPRRSNERQGILGRVIPLIGIFALAFYGHSEYSRRVSPQSAIATQPGNQTSSYSFRCDGRTYCSQMTSCAEATFFLRNCPNVKMDGNNDGIPCEQQWCTSAFAR